MSNINEATNAIIKNVELFWAKLDKPVEPFGTKQWEIQIRFPKKRIKEMEQYGKVKETDETGVYSVNLKKKAIKADGTPAMKVDVVGTTIDPETEEPVRIDPKTIGNGSIGNVKVMLREYQIKGPKGNVTKEGTQVMLVKVQITDLVKYTPKSVNDFDYDDEAPVEDDDIPTKNKAPATPVKGKPGRKPAPESKFEDMDDDIPF